VTGTAELDAVDELVAADMAGDDIEASDVN
jgi:hypothetical protein